MDINDFIDLVRRMRAAQKAYFTQGRKHGDLIASKQLEKEVDQALSEVGNNTENGQIPMFEDKK